MTETVVVAILALLGTLGGAYLSNRKSGALIAYRLAQLEEKVNKHNQVVERTYKLEEQQKVAERRMEALERVWEFAEGGGR